MCKSRSKVPNPFLIWIFSSKTFLGLLGIPFILCICASYFLTNDFSWIAIYLPVIIAIIFQRYSEDMKDARECERKTNFALQELKAYVVSQKLVFIERYKAMLNLDTTFLKSDVEGLTDFHTRIDDFLNRLNQVSIMIDYSLQCPVKMLFFKQVRMLYDAIRTLSDFDKVLSRYADVLFISQRERERDVPYSQHRMLLIEMVEKGIESQYKAPEFLKKVEEAFEYIEKIELESIFAGVRKANLAA